MPFSWSQRVAGLVDRGGESVWIYGRVGFDGHRTRSEIDIHLGDALDLRHFGCHGSHAMTARHPGNVERFDTHDISSRRSKPQQLILDTQGGYNLNYTYPHPVLQLRWRGQ